MGSPQPYKGGGGINSHVVIGGVIAVLLIIFILQNTKSTSIHFLFFSFSRAPVADHPDRGRARLLCSTASSGAPYRKWRGKDDTTA